MERIETTAAPAAIGPYSQAYRTGNLVFTSGQIALDPASGDLPVGIDAQAEQACRNVQAILEAAGAHLGTVVKTTCYLRHMSDFAAFNAVYARYFTGRPARSCVEVAALPKGALCEIEAVAEIA